MNVDPFIEAIRLLDTSTPWERRIRHFYVLCDAGVPADEAERIITETYREELRRAA